MEEFNIEKLKRKNIYKVPDDLFENIQGKVLSGVSSFDLEALERKNIYTVSENVYENIQKHVTTTLFPEKKAPVFRLKWAYAAAASAALIFGATFVFSLNDAPVQNQVYSPVAHIDGRQDKNTDSETAYKTLKSDLTSVENNNQTTESSRNNRSLTKVSGTEKTSVNTATKAAPAVSKENETQMNAYLDSFTNSEISELANNSTQDVYLDLYN